MLRDRLQMPSRTGRPWRRNGGRIRVIAVVLAVLTRNPPESGAVEAPGAAGSPGAAFVDDLNDLFQVSSRSGQLLLDRGTKVGDDGSRAMRSGTSEGREWVEYGRDGADVAQWRFVGFHWTGAQVRPFSARVATEGGIYQPLPMETTNLGVKDGWNVVEYRCAKLPAAASSVAVVYPDIDDEQSWNPQLAEVGIQYAPRPASGGSPSPSPVVRLENARVEVTCAAPRGLFTMKDKRSGEVWAQKMADLRSWALVDAKQDGDVLRLECVRRCPGVASSLTFRVDVRLDAEEPEVVFAIDADPAMEVDSFAYPSPFYLGASDAYAVFPSREGRLLAENSRNPRFARDEAGRDVIDRPWPAMRCFGSVRLRAGTACLGILETPDDGLIGRSEIREDGTDFAGLSPLWQPEMGRFGYRRCVRYRLFAEGGYVAMAAHYRRYVQAHGMFRSLADKARSIPLLEASTRGAILECAGMDQVESVAIARLLRAQGYEGSFTDDFDGWYRRGGPLEWKYGILQHHPGTAVCYKDLLPRDESDFGILQKKRDGRYAVGWMLGNTVMAAICQDRIRDFAAHYLPYFLQVNQCGFIYHDTTSAMPLQECHHPDHPLTRRQEKQKKIELLEWLAAGGIMTGSEDAADWAAAHLAVLAGPSSRGHLSGIAIPFFSLIFHDSVVSRYRADWTFHDKPESFAQKKAHSLLYGDPPVLRWRTDLDAKQREDICRKSIGVQKFFEQVAFRELRGHAFLNDDLTLEKCTFDGAEAYANFSTSPARIDLPGGPAVLAPYGYFAQAENFLGYDVLREGARCEYVRSPGFVFADTASAFESDTVRCGAGGARISASRLSPGRMLVFNESAGAPRLAPRMLAPEWDVATTRAFRLNEADERVGDVPLVRDGSDWVGVPGTGVLEVVCGPAAAGPDLRVDPGSVRFSETALRGGESVTVSATVTNVAEGPANAEVRFYRDSVASEDGLLAVQPLMLGGQGGATVSATLATGGLQGRRNMWVLVREKGGREVNLLNNADSAYLEIGEPFHARFQRKAFDFGTGACQPGFIPVLNEPYSSARGWGWIADTNMPPLQGLLGWPSPNPPAAGGVYVVACKGLSWAGPLLGDAVGVGRYRIVGQPTPPPKADYTFAVDLTNGDYRVTVLMVSGVRAWQTEIMLADVTLNGQLIASPATHKYEKGHFFLTRDVKVVDGQVRLRFVGDWWQLCGLTIADAGPAGPAPSP